MRPRVRHPPMYNRVLRNPIHPVVRRVQSVAADALDGVGAALHQNHCRNRSLSKGWAFCRSWCASSSTRHCGPSGSSTWGMSTVTGPTRARTVNGLERLNREIRRRTRVAVLYPQRGFPPGPGNGDCQGGQRGVADRPTLSPSAPTPPPYPYSRAASSSRSLPPASWRSACPIPAPCQRRVVLSRRSLSSCRAILRCWRRHCISRSRA